MKLRSSKYLSAKLATDSAPQRLATRLLRSHMAVAGLGLVILCVIAANLLQIRAALVAITQVEAPMATASRQLSAGVEQSQAQLRAWVLSNDQRFVRGRQQVWRERVEPALATVQTLRHEAAIGMQSAVDKVQEQLAVLQRLQQQIERGVATPDNLPLMTLLNNDLQPLFDELYVTIASMVLMEQRANAGSRQQILTIMLDYRNNLLHSYTTLASLAQAVSAPSEVALYEQADAVGRQLFVLESRRDALNLEQRNALHRLRVLSARYSTLTKQMIMQRRTEGWNRSLVLFEEQAMPQTLAVAQLLEGLTKSGAKQVMTSAHRLEYLSTAGLVLSLIGLASLIAAAHYSARRTARHLVEPIAQLSRATEQMASGELGSEIAVYRDDELGLLTRSFNRMCATVVETKRELKARDEDSRAIINSYPGAIVMVDADGLIAMLNERAASMFGYQRDGLLGQSIEVLVPEPQRRDHMALRKGYLQQPGSRPMGAGRDLFGRCLDGSTFPIEIGLASVVVGAKSVTLASLVDLTERQRIQESLQEAAAAAKGASRTKSEFLANMSHEIRTPLNGIVGMTELLSGTGLSKAQQEYLDMANQSIEQLLLVINDILDFSRIEAGKLVLEDEDFALSDALGDTLRTLAPRAVDKGLELAYRVSSEVPDCLCGDLGRLRQILINLVGNAIKFTHQGEVLVDVTVDADSADGSSDNDYLHFCVIDTGIGIVPNQQQRIFDSFTQVEGSTTRNFGGSGLGLAICQQLLAMMQGRIWVDSEPGRGSRFHFILPLRRGSGQATVVHELPDELRDLPVLVVDDNATNRRIMSDLLVHWGMSPVLCCNGAEALNALANAQANGEHFGLLLLDYMMPGMDGIELARRIAQIDFGQKRPRALLLSSAGHQLSQEECSALAIQRVLIKPLKPSELFDAIAGALLQLRVRTAPALTGTTTTHTPPRDVLLVEDGIANQMVAKAMLQKRGHRVTIANDGRQAVDLVQQQRFDLILMDVQMPVLDGYDATREIREREATSGIRTRIIAMTANAMTGDREKCLEAGMDDYLSKPVRAADLYAFVEQAEEK